MKNRISLFFFINYLLGLWLVADTIPFTTIAKDGFLVCAYLCITFLLYGAFYWIPAIGLTTITYRLFSCRPKLVVGTAIFTAALTTLLLYANAKLFSLYGMYINGFVLNLIFTPGGIESLGGSQASQLGFVAIALIFLALALALWWFSNKFSDKPISQPIMKAAASFRHWPMRISLLLAIVVLHLAFAYDALTANKLAPIAEAVPFYQTTTARNFFKLFGLKPKRDTSLQLKGKVNYPLAPLQITPPAKPLNIIWLVSESWRADTLDETVMPQTWAFSKQAMRFTRNYSGGNGTRMGVFSMMMGIPGSYWFQFLQARRGAAILDVLKQEHYDMQFYTSAKFSYPEFNQTIFAQIPSTQLHDQNTAGTGWENDQHNVTALLQSIDALDKKQPFFRFMFFESPHARYYFPPESVIAKPYKDDLNYATLSKEALHKDIALIKNRYINSVHHLDSQFGRIFDYLKTHQLIDNTVVVILGDHGEEFMEHGFWGHNATFVDQQVRTPLVIYIPGQAPKVSDQLTSHMDVVPTLMPLLGVNNPKTDYSLGVNLLKGEVRDHTYIADWDKLVYMDNEVKVQQPVGGKSLFSQKITTVDDKPLSGESAKAMLAKKQPEMVQIMRDLSHFLKKSQP